MPSPNWVSPLPLEGRARAGVSAAPQAARSVESTPPPPPIPRLKGEGSQPLAANIKLRGMATGPQQQIEEHSAADDSDHDADRDFIGIADDAAQNIAGQYEAGAAHRHPGHGAAHIVADHQADQIGDDQAKKRN